MLLAWGTPQVAAQPESKVNVTAALVADKVAPGGKALVTVTFAIEETWHIYPQDWSALGGESGTGILSTAGVTFADKSGLSARAAQWPKPIVKMVGTGKAAERSAFLEGNAVVYIPVVIDADAAPGPREIKVSWSSQACTDKGVCLFEEPGDATLTLTIAADAPQAPASWPAGFDANGFDALPAGTTPLSSVIDLGLFKIDAAGAFGLVLLMSVCALAGFILNLMPCVLPVIPIKIAGFQRAAEHQGGGRGRAFLLGLMTALGIVAFWFVIAMLISVVKVVDSVNFLFGHPLFQLGAAAVIGIMAVGLMGAFTIQLPQALYSINVGHDTLKGSFLFGVMTAVLGTPCFGPFIGAALSWATQQDNALIPLMAMTFVGIGMALPYVVLAAFPALTKKLPKAGPGSDLIKQVMGLMMIAVAVFFLGNGILALVAEAPFMKAMIHWWVMTFLIVFASLWLLFKGIPNARSAFGKGLIFVTALVVGGGMLAWTLRLHSVEKRIHEANASWIAYSPEAEKAALAAGKTVVIDFTAEWCLNCKFLKAGPLSEQGVIDALKDPNVVAMIADLTSRSAPGWKRLKEIKEVGIPVVSYQGPGAQEPLKSYFPSSEAEIVGLINKASNRAERETRGAFRNALPWTPEEEQAAKAEGRTVLTVFTADWDINAAWPFAATQIPEVSVALADPVVRVFIADVSSRSSPAWNKLKALGEVGVPLISVENADSPQPRFLYDTFSAAEARNAFAKPPRGS
jgi:thiol:disulfide interchange protein DsbD